MLTYDLNNKKTGWFDPVSGNPCDIGHIIARIASKNSYTVHVGTDSHRVKSKEHAGVMGYMFATVICLYEPGKGADYYCRRHFRPTKYDSLRLRINDEVSESVDVSLMLMEQLPACQISVHADINSDPRYKTNSYLQGVRAWIQSIGFKFLCKPHAWASSGVADKHAK